jgi:hypothetical protein
MCTFVWFDVIFFQVAALKEEVESATSSMEQSEAKIKRIEIQVREPNE